MDVQLSTLPFNGVAIVFACTLALILLWYNWRKGAIQLYALLVVFMVLWNVGSLVLAFERATPLLGANTLVRLLMGVGYIGSGIILYALTISLVRLFTPRIRILTGISLVSILVLQVSFVLLVVSPSEVNLPINPLHMLIGLFTLFLTFRYRKRLEPVVLHLAVGLFVTGQLAPLTNPQIGADNLSLLFCSLSTLLLGVAFTKREVIAPLQERSIQIASMQEVAQAVSAKTQVSDLLSEIATQAAQWLKADASGIFLRRQTNQYQLVASLNLPSAYANHAIHKGEGLIGQSIQLNKTMVIASSDARFGQLVLPSFPFGADLFGCVIVAPLRNQEDVIGAITVISSRHGRLFTDDDSVLLEIMAAEASIGIAYSQIAQEIELSRHNLEHVLDTTGNPIITINEHGIVQYANKMARNLQGKGYLLIPVDWIAGLGRQSWYEQKLDGRFYNCQSVQLEGRNPSQWLIAYSDVTREKEISTLRDDVIRLTSHDIKNPLQGAINNLELLQEDLSNIENPEIQVSLGELDTQLRRIEKITTTILSASHELTNETCSLTEILKATMEEAHQQASRRKQQLVLQDHEESILVNGAREQLKRAFINLVDNALKYSPPDSIVTISITMDAGRGIIAIADRGVGIPHALQGKVFRPFFRGQDHGQQAQTTGTGVGLSIVQSIIENHGGKIWFTSTEGVGTIFYVSLPVVRQESSVSSIQEQSHL
jgi:signal transduction histidine kinase